MPNHPAAPLAPAGRVPGRLVRVLLAALALLVAAAWAAGPAAAASSGDQDVTWTVRTASNDFGADRTAFGYTLDPGRTLSDGLVVANHGDTALTLSVYAADGYTTDAGQFDLLVGGSTSVGVGAWVHAAKATITVAPGKTVTVPFTVAVPKTATPGDYAGGIVTSLRQSDAADDTITVDRRLGVKVTLHVGGTLTPALAVEGVHVTHATTLDPLGRGDATVTYTLHNTGNAIVTARQAVAVKGPFGLLAAHATPTGTVPDLLPGETWPVTVRVPDVAASGVLSATVTATPLYTDASGTTAPLVAVTGTSRTWAPPWVLVGLIVIVAAAVVLGVRRARRNRRRAREREDARVQEAVAEALRERAEAGSAG